MNDLIINALITIGNHKAVIKECEPNIMRPLELKKWMVVRTMKAFLLFQDEMEKRSNEVESDIELWLK